MLIYAQVLYSDKEQKKWSFKRQRNFEASSQYQKTSLMFEGRDYGPITLN